jgi:hypothetical protein
MQNLMKILAANLEPLHVDVQTDGQTDRQTDMAEVGAAFLVLFAYQCAEDLYRNI